MELRTILAGLDQSPAAADAFRIATRLATGAHAALATVTVVENPHHWIERGEPATLGVVTARVRERLKAPGDHIVRVGAPGVELARAAELLGADLLVLGFNRRVGTTLEGTLRRSQVPCLVTPSGVPAFRRVCAAVDGGPASAIVLAAALAVADHNVSDVIIFHAERVPSAADAGLPRRDTMRHVEALTEAVHAAWSRDRAARAVAGCEVIVRQGDPVVEILKIVREEHVDLLVVGACRGAAAGGNAARSIATRLLERARSAMLTVPV